MERNRPSANIGSNLSRHIHEVHRFPILGADVERALCCRRRDPSRYLRRSTVGRQSPASRRQDCHGLSRLRPATGRPDRGRPCRPHARALSVRPGSRGTLRYLRDLVGTRSGPGIHPAQLVAGEDGHDRFPEEVVLQFATHAPAVARMRRRHADDLRTVLTLDHGNIVLSRFDDFMAQAAAEHLPAHLERSSLLAVKNSPKLLPREVQRRGTAAG